MEMPFVWDEHKRLANLQKHGLDFADVIFFDWESALVTPTHSNRFKAMGYFEDGTAVVIYGLLGSEAVSIISFRPASPKEREGAIPMTAKYPAKQDFQPGHGYSKEDWDSIDSPELTDEEMARLRPARKVLPSGFFEAVNEARKARGRPPMQQTKKSVTIRLDVDLYEHYKAKGDRWQTQMNNDLRKLAGLK
jgi:uncharacterized DUF497 family protein/uncharacterized protein (DUF4415 family)